MLSLPPSRHTHQIHPWVDHEGRHSLRNAPAMPDVHQQHLVIQGKLSAEGCAACPLVKEGRASVINPSTRGRPWKRACTMALACEALDARCKKNAC